MKSTTIRHVGAYGYNGRYVATHPSRHVEREDIPPELLELPAGRYIVEPVREDAPVLRPEEEAGIEVLLNSYRQGRVVDAKRVREIIDAAIGR